MYRTPGRSPQHGRSSRAGSPQSGLQSHVPVHAEGQDRLINTLKKELGALQKNFQGLGEAHSRLANLNHKYKIIYTEKIRDEEAFRKKENEQAVELARVADELRLAQEKLLKREGEVHDIRNDFQRMDQELSTKLDIRQQLERQYQAETGELQYLCEEKDKLESSQHTIQREQHEAFSGNDTRVKELEMLKDQLTQSKRKQKEQKGELQQLKADNSETQNSLYKVEEELKNLMVGQRTKEATFRRLTEKANMIESDSGLLDGEKERLREGLYVKNETLNALSGVKSELLRRETSLANEKADVDQAIEAAELEINQRRVVLDQLETEHLSGQSELKNLRLIYDRLAGDNQKLLQALVQCSDADLKTSRELERFERIESIKLEAERELVQAINILRD